MKEYLVLHGRARIVEGEASELLAKLARVYLGPAAAFAPAEYRVPAQVMRITVERIGGIGPWTDGG